MSAGPALPWGYCDLHNHLLPGLDDGAKTLADTLEMARGLVELGFDAAAPSPHNRPEYAGAQEALARLAQVQEALTGAGIALTLHPNSENTFLDETLVSALGTPRARLLGAGRYMLVEAPYSAPLPALLQVIFQLKLKGVTPLIAHPERCVEFDRKGRAAEAVRAGARLQLDIAALIGRYGPRARQLACAWLDEGLYAVAATDMHAPHNVRGWVEESMAALRRRVGDRALGLLMAEHPHRVLAGETLEM